MCILGFDPGKDKCGIAVRSSTGKIYTHEVIASSQAIERLASLCQQYPIELLVMGNQTTSKSWHQKIVSYLKARSDCLQRFCCNKRLMQCVVINRNFFKFLLHRQP